MGQKVSFSVKFIPMNFSIFWEMLTESGKYAVCAKKSMNELVLMKYDCCHYYSLIKGKNEFY